MLLGVSVDRLMDFVVCTPSPVPAVAEILHVRLGPRSSAAAPTTHGADRPRRPDRDPPCTTTENRPLLSTRPCARRASFHCPSRRAPTRPATGHKCLTCR